MNTTQMIHIKLTDNLKINLIHFLGKLLILNYFLKDVEPYYWDPNALNGQGAEIPHIPKWRLVIYSNYE